MHTDPLGWLFLAVVCVGVPAVFWVIDRRLDRQWAADRSYLEWLWAMDRLRAGGRQ